MVAEPILMSFTVWEFLSPSTGERKVVAKPTEPFEPEHEYQKVLRRVETYTASRALFVAMGFLRESDLVLTPKELIDA